MSRVLQLGFAATLLLAGSVSAHAQAASDAVPQAAPDAVQPQLANNTDLRPGGAAGDPKPTVNGSFQSLLASLGLTSSDETTQTASVDDQH